MKRTNIGKICILSLIMFVLPVLLQAADPGKLAVGLGYPYFLVKYAPFEVKYATDDGINLFAGRWYMDFYENGKVCGFTGVEGGYVKFNTLDIKGQGYEGGIFIGGEYLVTKNIALGIDLSPTYLQLKSDDSYKASGFELVFNAAVYYYFPTGKKSFR